MNELELIKKARTDENAFEKLLADYKLLVCKISRSYFIVGGDIDDLIQEGMIGLYKAINTYDENKNTSFKTFAILCIKRQIQTAIKKSNTNKSKMFHKLFGKDEINFFDVPSNKENPEENFISRENCNTINDAIKTTLSKMEQNVLSEYLQWYSYDQIANNLGMNKKSVDNALGRIRSKLSHFLSDINY